jgi:hypothetical protein
MDANAKQVPTFDPPRGPRTTVRPPATRRTRDTSRVETGTPPTKVEPQGMRSGSTNGNPRQIEGTPPLIPVRRAALRSAGDGDEQPPPG